MLRRRGSWTWLVALAVVWVLPLPAGQGGGSAASGPEMDHLRVVLIYEQGSVRLVRLERAPGAARRISSEAGGWWAETFSSTGNRLDARYLRDPRRLHVEWLDQQTAELRGYEVMLERATFAIVLPVSPGEAERLDLYEREGRLLASVSLDGPLREPGAGQPAAGGADSCSGGWATAQARDNGPPANRLNITFLGDGYTATQLDSYAMDVDNTIDYLLSREPYREYQNFINFWRVDVISNESGADEPDNGIERDTALDCSFNWGGTPRCLFCPSEPVNDAAGCVPETDEILVVVNTSRYGGCGGGYAVYAGKNSNATDIAFHEMGHSFAGLADEYGGGGTWPPFEHPDPNCSIYSEPQMESLQTKWWYWLGDEGVSTFQECAARGSGVNRPIFDCEMRSLHRSLGAVCREEHTLDYHTRVDPIDDALPAGDPTILQQETASFSIVRVPPLTHEQDVAWHLDDAPLPGANGDELMVAGEDVALGDHPVRVEVSDPTPYVRSDPLGLLKSERSWTLHVTCQGDPADYDTDGDGICQQGLGGRDCNDDDGQSWSVPGETRNLLFTDKQSLSWDAPQDAGGDPGALVYDTLRSDDPSSFAAATCVESDDGADSVAADPSTPPLGSVYHYLTRAGNGCPDDGSLGTDSSGSERAGVAC